MKLDDEENNEKIIEAVAEKICAQDKPSLMALKSQLYFAKHHHDRGESEFEIIETNNAQRIEGKFISLGEIVKRHRLRLHQKTGPMVAEICENVKICSNQESEKLYQKILVVITFLSGLGNPTVPSVLR